MAGTKSHWNTEQIVLLDSLNENKKVSIAYKLFTSAIKTPKTLVTYKLALDKFMIESNHTNYDEVIKLDPTVLQKELQIFVMSLSHLKHASVNAYLSSVELFFEMNQVLLHKRILRKLMPNNDEKQAGSLPYTDENIRKMLSVTIKIRSKFLIHFFSSTGARPLSVQDPVLRLKHVEDMALNCKSVKIYDGSKQEYYAFLTPECSKALDDYLNQRRLGGEVLTKESPLLINVVTNLNTKNDFMSATSVRQVIKEAVKKSGIDRKLSHGSRNEIALFGGFRKRFNTIMKLSEANDNIVEKLMSHKKGLDGTYLTPTKDECFNEFTKGMSNLTLDQTERQRIEITQLETDKAVLEKAQKENASMKDSPQMKEMIREVIFEDKATDPTAVMLMKEMMKENKTLTERLDKLEASKK